MEMPHKWIILIASMLLISSCYEREEGCLDVLSSNFAVDADDDCCAGKGECCCTYPKLTISVKHQMDSNNLSSDSIYYTDFGQPFTVDQVEFFISNVRLFIDSESYAITDEIEITASTGEIIARPDDIKVMSTSTFSSSIGSFTKPGTFTELRFLVGITEPEKSASRDQFLDDHPLAETSDDLRDESGELLLYDINWRPDTASADPTVLRRSLEAPIEVRIPINLEKQAGDAVTIGLGIDYLSWFRTIDVGTDSEEVQKSKIEASIPGSFSAL